MRVGAVIEERPENPLGIIHANLFVEPSGVVHVTSAQERILNKSNPHEILGSVYPQSLIPYEALRVSLCKYRVIPLEIFMFLGCLCGCW